MMNENNPQEKKSTVSEKSQRWVLIMMGVVVFALVASLFVGGNKSSSAKTPLNTNNDANQNSRNDNAFLDQVNFDKNQSSFKQHNRKLIHDIRNEEGLKVQESDPADWSKEEEVRALDSRKAGFGFNVSTKQQSQQTASNNSMQSTPGSDGMSMNKSGSALPLTAEQVEKLEQKFGNQSTTGKNDGYSGPDINQAGKELQGHAINDAYDKQVLNGELLLPTGTRVAGVLDQDVQSDYIGPWSGHLVEDVYSTDNQFILLPKGTKLFGDSVHITNVNEPIQNRMGLTIKWVVLPNGKRIDFSKNAVADRSGIAAIGDQVDQHLLWQFGGVAAYALVSASLPRDQYNYYGVDTQPTFKGEFSDGLRQQLAPMISKYLSLIPTVTLRIGTPIKVITQDDLYIAPWSRVNTTVYSWN